MKYAIFKEVESVSKYMNIIFFILFTLLSTHSYTAGWKIEGVDTINGVADRPTSIAVDSNNKIHIAYAFVDQNSNRWHDGLKYATNASNSWLYSTVDKEPGDNLYSSIAIDKNNKVHICYDKNRINLKYATNSSGSLVTSTLETSNHGGYYTPSIAIDGNNKVHISYHDSLNYTLKYATNVSDSWVFSTLVGGGNPSSIAIDSNNKVHISFASDTGPSILGYATNSSGSWEYSILGAGGCGTSIAIDRNNKIHILHHTYHSPVIKKDYTLEYATNSSGSWVNSTLNDNQSGEGFIISPEHSIVTDNNNKVHIVYQSNTYIKYMTNASGSWKCSEIEQGRNCAIAIDSNNKVHISYISYPDGNVLKYATPKPELSWAGKTNYMSDGVDPELGEENTPFTFRVKYTDIYNNTPATGYPKLHIKKAGSEISGSPFTMSYISGTYSEGAIYSYSTTLTAIGTDYTYYFEAKNSNNEDVPGTPTSSVDAPDVMSQIVTTGNGTQITTDSQTIVVTIDIPAGTFQEDVGVTISITITLPDVTQPTFKKSDIGIEVLLNKNIKPQKELTITMGYKDSDLTKYGLEEKKLVIAYYDEDNKNWVNIPSTVYTDQKKVTGKTRHLSKFRLLQLVSANNLSEVIAYPTPYKPNSGLGHTNITFKGLTSTASIKIFTITGELVHKYEETDGDGIYQWDVKNDNGEAIASGTYIYLVTNNQGEKATGKIVIIK